MKCLFSDTSYMYIWNVRLGNVISIKCSIYEMSHLWYVLSMKCPFYEMSHLWNVPSLKVYSFIHIFRLSWNIFKITADPDITFQYDTGCKIKSILCRSNVRDSCILSKVTQTLYIDEIKDHITETAKVERVRSWLRQCIVLACSSTFFPIFFANAILRKNINGVYYIFLQKDLCSFLNASMFLHLFIYSKYVYILPCKICVC